MAAVGATQAMAATRATPATAVDEYAAPYEEEKKRSGWFIAVLIILLVILAGLLFAFFKVLTNKDNGAATV